MDQQSRPAPRVTPDRRGRGRARRGATAVGALTLALLGTGVAAPLTAAADPAPVPAATTFGVGSAFSGSAPDGACAVTATVVGGAGGRSASGAGGVGSNGAGALITATFPVLPGTAFSGTVGGGGQSHSGNVAGAGGVNGGGRGGNAATDHAGAGGGGFSALYLGGSDEADLAVVAGGGGGSGGGHSTTDDGFGGDAGRLTAPGTAAGDAGTDGRDATGQLPGGGQGGTGAGPGAGGAHSTDATLDGTAGTGRTGGAGADDPNYDAAGGGGGGYFGAGGGASTSIKNGDNNINDVAGAGGGGGSSFVAAGATTVTSTAHGRQTGVGAGQNGYVTLAWVPCAYDLAVAKTAAVAPAGATPDVALPGSTITWTVTVTNDGPQAMTRGDVVTLTDTLPGASAAVLTGVTTTGGLSTQLERGPITCDVAVGAPMAETLTCSRPFAHVGGAADGVRGLDVGERLTVTYTQTATDPAGTVLANTAEVTDRGLPGDNTATATVTVAGPPSATDDADLGNTIGEVVAVPVLANDTPGIAAGTVVLQDGAAWVTELVVDGEGTWTVAGGVVTFTPEPGFLVDPTPVTYRITDANGLTDTAEVTVTYVPTATPDSDLANPIGTPVTVDVLADDLGDLDPTSVRLVGPTGPVTTLVVAGEGTWTVDPATGAVTFTPEAGYELDPTPVTYQVTDSTGDTVGATVTVGYAPDAVDDEDRGNVIGDAVTLDVVGNDVGAMDPTTVRLLDGTDPVSTLVVAGEGTWTVDPVTGAVTFTPEAGFTLNPTPVTYTVTDVTGDASTATVTVTYLPVADPDVVTGGTIGQPVTVPVLPNDTGTLDPASVRLVDPATGDRVTTLVVAGQGTWTVDTTTGAITFTPESGFLGNPTPVGYEVRTTAGDAALSTATVTYVPQALDDRKDGNPSGSTVTVDPIGNDRGVFDPTSVRLVTPGTGALVTTLTVAGEGTWSVSATTGAITFAPQAGFTGDPTPVTYQVTDLAGSTTTAQVRLTYTAPAAPAVAGAAGGLATTGWSPAVPAGAALGLVLLGALTVAATRRRALR
ncbi:hypothetical protein ICW40_14595 [Actinotalea ferrariae]|uniref:Ig-like domain-containing protein n=1 Tax=Actinotalea ferrariae TaxID=1386098 RepID=UPI001C8CF07D|nr:DUF11 domain-containing protein [Actinotalea ferrariae]MBX9246032.1 hypothetical protein [Actinotalea ferrariae]